METDVLQAFLVTVIVLGYGTGVSFLQERFGKFNDLPSNVKQLVNSVLTLILPYVVAFVQPYWRLEFGDVNQVLSSVFYLVVPILIFVVSQFAHAVDKRILPQK